MRELLLLAMVVMLMTLLMVVAPEGLEIALEVVLSVVLFVTYVLVVAISFSIASLVFFACCLRFGDDGEALDEPTTHEYQFWMWTRWG